MRKTHSFFAGFFYKKKGLCAENAEANSERNLYTPLRSGTKPSHNVKAVIALSFALQLKFNVKTLKRQINTATFSLFFYSPIKPRAHKNKSEKNPLDGKKNLRPKIVSAVWAYNLCPYSLFFALLLSASISSILALLFSPSINSSIASPLICFSSVSTIPPFTSSSSGTTAGFLSYTLAI